MTAGTKKKLEKFLQSSTLQERFLKAVLLADPSDILWPESNPGRFGKTFIHTENSKKLVYPLSDDHIKLQSLEFRLKAAQSDTELSVSPAITYYYLKKFENELLKKPLYRKALKESPKRSVRKKIPKLSGKKKTAPKKTVIFPGDNQILARDVLDKLNGIIKKIKVPSSLKKAKDEAELLSAVFTEEKNITKKYREVSNSLDSCRVELSFFRNPEFMHQKHRKKMDELQHELSEYEEMLKRETSRSNLLENEVNRLAEQIISDSFLLRDRSDAQEISDLRKEHAVLSQKYDTLVSKNIDLSNRLEKAKSSKSLEMILDSIRDKINVALKSGVAGNKEGDETLLRSLQSEIGQIQRARIYLGRALFDMGILFLRLGDKNRAREELRAARELGIEDPETNRILNKTE